MTVSQQKTSTNEYAYDLPKELIAQQPTQNREDARLMIVDREKQTIEHSHFRDLAEWLNAGDCLVLNESKVVPAKLIGFRTQTGGRWHGLYLEHDEETGVWRVLCKTRGNIQPGETITLQDRNGVERVKFSMVAKLGGGCWAIRPLEFDGSAEELLGVVGRIPLPHYIRDGNMTDADFEDYQTVYANTPGSVAAPTAGLHFTERLLKQAAEKGVRVAKLTLHVGMGTFRPIGTDNVESHEMHGEWGSVDESTVGKVRETQIERGRVIAVGTTSVRLLESASQSGKLASWQGTTDLYIHPPYEFQTVTSMITNFHLPRTTLLVLVRTLGGDALMKKAYQEAIDQEYRFYSYGDAMMII